MTTVLFTIWSRKYQQSNPGKPKSPESRNTQNLQRRTPRNLETLKLQREGIKLLRMFLLASVVKIQNKFVVEV